jgi:hypothetical protein
MKNSGRATWLVILWFLANPANAIALTISAEYFGYWTYGASFSSNGHSGVITIWSTGGNPDNYLRFISQPDDHRQGISSWFLVAAVSDHAPVDLALSGPIRSIAFSNDVKRSGEAANEVETGLMLTQNGRTFINRWESPFGYSWTTRARDNLTASDFIAIIDAPGNGFDVTRHPDFSSSGEPIRLGVYFLGLRFPTTMFSAEAGVDNWRADISFVPEPSTLALSSFALLSLAALRRRK